MDTVKEKEIERKEKEQEIEQMVYIGPSIRGIVTRFSAFYHGIPPGLKKAVKELPMLSSLLVPVKQYAQKKQEVEIQGTALHTIYQKAEEKIFAWEKERRE